MMIISTFLSVLLFLSGCGGQGKDVIVATPLVDNHSLAHDMNQFQTMQQLKRLEDEFEQQVDYYLSITNDQLHVDEMKHLIKEANRHHIPTEVLLKLLKVESNFNKDLVGPPTKYGHAYGMAQFMKNTAPWISDMAELEYDFQKLFDPFFSITLAATYLHYLQYGDGLSHQGYHDWHSTLTAYNRGMGGLRAYQQRHKTTESTYSKLILTQAEQVALNFP